MRQWELGGLLLLLRMLLSLLQIGTQHVHHGFRTANLGLPVMRFRVQLRASLQKLLLLQLRLLQFHVFLPQLPRERLLHGGHELVGVSLPLLIQIRLELLILNFQELRDFISFLS